MIPPLIRRCPVCRHVNWSRQFPFVATDDGEQLVECPSCHHRFEPIDNPRLQ